ncbi:MAG: HAD-IIA family hydrolase [Aigarchaeota archaeon]|nr:HAD-IIA family hydrolase [Aigarchaeota archaeon]MCS7127239.1 HAD-IIA family hydrolase [Candidatus Calditenuaceae archaeon]MDW8042694.1 HAD-IIA family hydrolase [Nitrososphaerota archaeon]
MSVKGLVLDLDGTVILGSRLVERAVESIAACRDAGLRLTFLTNNSTYSVRYVLWKLRSLGLDCRLEEIITSSYATAKYLLENHGEVRAYVIGEAGLIEELVRSGHSVVGAAESEVVVVGLDRNVTYSKLAEACRAVLRGAEFVATNRDRYLPLEDGGIPGAGSIVAFIEAATNRSPVVVGKPNVEMLEFAMRRMGLGREEVVVIGDNPETDAEMAVRAGVKCVLVGGRPDPSLAGKGVEFSPSLAEALNTLLKRDPSD